MANKKEEKLYQVKRIVPYDERDDSNLPHLDIETYTLEQICKQGFLASMIDDEHYIEVKLLTK